MSFKIGEKYRSKYTDQEDLEVVHVYNGGMAKLKIGETKRHVVAKGDTLGEKHIVLAHISKLETLLEKVSGKLVSNKGEPIW